MKLAKTAFILALFNFLMVMAVIVNSRQPVIAEPTATMAVPTKAPGQKPAIKKTIIAEGSRPVVIPTEVPAAPVVDNRCLIVVDGARYDVTSFRNLHSGGNIFQCGSDMSAVFHQQHDNSYLSRMSQYKI